MISFVKCNKLPTCLTVQWKLEDAVQVQYVKRSPKAFSVNGSLGTAPNKVDY